MNRIAEQHAESAAAVWDLKKVRFNRLLQNIWANSGMVVVYIVMFIACSVFVPYFFTLRNMIGLALSITTIGMIACTMMFILAAGDLDLSVGSIVAFSGISAATVINQTGDVYIGALAGVIGGGAVGLLNGTLIAVFNLNPLVLETALEKRPHIKVFGTDYPTPDGTCIRDYIHVEDLAGAHLLALEALESRRSLQYNLGNGLGYSVRQVIEAARRVTGHPVPVVEEPRRPGDPAILVAGSDRIRRELGWEPKRPGLDDIIESAWLWRQAHPMGYGDT